MNESNERIKVDDFSFYFGLLSGLTIGISLLVLLMSR